MNKLYITILMVFFFQLVHSADDVVAIQKKNNDEQNKNVQFTLSSIKDSIHAFSSVLKSDDELRYKVIYFEFSRFDNINSFDLFRYILKDKNVLKFCPTKSAFAIVVTPEFNLDQFKQFAISNTFDLIEIERNEYNKSLELK